MYGSIPTACKFNISEESQGHTTILKVVYTQIRNLNFFFRWRATVSFRVCRGRRWAPSKSSLLVGANQRREGLTGRIRLVRPRGAKPEGTRPFAAIPHCVPTQGSSGDGFVFTFLRTIRNLKEIRRANGPRRVRPCKPPLFAYYCTIIFDNMAPPWGVGWRKCDPCSPLEVPPKFRRCFQRGPKTEPKNH